MQSLAHLMYKFFHGRRDTWGVRRGSEYFRVTGKEITWEDYSRHIAGEQVIGIYPLLENGLTCRVAAIDIDRDDIELTRQASLLLPQPNYIERSRSGNFHIWMFFNEPVVVDGLYAACHKALTFVKRQCKDHCNLYPLHAKGIGVLIALPFQHDAVEEGKTCFIEAEPTLEAQFRFLQQLTYTEAPGSFLDNKHLKDLWEGNGKTSGDTSRSGYDFTFCIELAKLGYSREGLRSILHKRPGLHQSDEDYIVRTVEAALAAVATVGVAAQAAPQATKDWASLEAIPRGEFIERLRKRLILGSEQLQQLDLFFATLVANLKTKGRPVWMMFVGPPGCGKTLPMMALQFAPYVYMTSAFRPTALISGWGLKGGQDMSLIPKLDGKVLMVKDMSSLLSQHKEIVAEVLGLLRDAYDGACSRSFGTGVERSYSSRFGFIGATTPDIDAHWALNVRLGERFLRYRCRATPEQVYEKIDQSLASLSTESEMDLEIEDASMRFLKYLMNEDTLWPKLSNAKVIGRLAQLGAILRTVVARSPFGHEVLVIPEWEEATRYAKQLAKLAMGLAYVRGKETNDDEELEDLKTVVRDAMDARVERICRELYTNPGREANEIADQICLPVWTVRTCLDDLAVARVVLHQRNSIKLTWHFVPWLEGQLDQFALWPKGKEKENEK